MKARRLRKTGAPAEYRTRSRSQRKHTKRSTCVIQTHGCEVVRESHVTVCDQRDTAWYTDAVVVRESHATVCDQRETAWYTDAV